MACIVVAYIVMAYIVMAYTVMVYIVMAYIDMAVSLPIHAGHCVAAYLAFAPTASGAHTLCPIYLGCCGAGLLGRPDFLVP